MLLYVLNLTVLSIYIHCIGKNYNSKYSNVDHSNGVPVAYVHVETVTRLWYREGNAKNKHILKSFSRRGSKGGGHTRRAPLYFRKEDF